MSELPQKIGPYEVLRSLGAGGMGEVFLAYDERLDRHVAIKRVRTDAGAPAERRERFRREARMAARLNHPSIVQIYDVLAEGDVHYIVMEYVEGTNLRRMLDDGPLDAETVLTLALDIARGLEEAHRQGIVHRDLKSENILVTASGHAKITDFGIAKRLLKEKTEESLTALGHVLGTYRAMSPEQARGEEVDHRSDLFSFGVLLYEALTGQSPFEAENELAMLHRIVHDRQRPARELNPEVPEELSRVVDHLLEKEPLLRPRSAGDVALALASLQIPEISPSGAVTLMTLAEPLQPFRRTASGGSGGVEVPRDSAPTPVRSRTRWVLALLVLLLAGGMGTAAYLTLRPPRAPLYVAMLPPEGVKGNESEVTELLSSGVRSALVRALASLEGISPKAAEEVGGTSGSPMQVARAVAADEVVAWRLSCRPEACQVTLDRIRGQDGALLWSESFDVPTDNLYLAARAAANQLRRGYADHRVRERTLEASVRSEDFAEFLRLRQRFDSRRDASLDPVLDGLADIRARSPRFLEVYLLEAEVARYKFSGSRHPEDLERALDLVRQARELAPEDPQPLHTQFAVALDAGRLDTAEEALNELEQLSPGDVAVLERRAQLLDARGRSREALAVMAEAARQRPSWKTLRKLAFFQYQQGETAAARGTLQQLLERSPGNFDGLALLAQIELGSGDPRRAAQLYQELVRRSPRTNQIANLGLAYFLLGRYSEAAEAFRQTTEREPRNALLALNLADSYLMMGRKAEAAAEYRRVLDLIAADPSATSPQFLTTKAQALAHLGQGRAAVLALQEALRQAPSNAQVAYEASLVYALLGESTSALVNAEKALRLGCEPRWFSFPWFNPLRSRPEFQALLRRAPSGS